MNTKKLCFMSLLTAIALIIFIIELRIPNIVPIPGVKLGLANIVTVFSVYHLKASETSMILFVRIFFGAVFGGNLSSIVYSFCGVFLCLAGMLVLKKFIDEDHIWICSILGAVMHNIGQTIAAIIMMKTTAVITYLPFLLVSGCIAGLFTGLCAQVLIKRLKIII